MVPFSGLVFTPQTTGEKRITLRVKPKEGELVQANNAVSTYVRVLSGGLNVRYIQGPSSPWEFKFTGGAIVKSPDIQADMNIIRREAQGDRGELSDDEFAPGRYDVYILGDLHARFLTRQQHRLLTQAVEKGAGLIMLGGHSSFGSGGWASTELARVLPMAIHPGDGQLEPEAGVKFVPMPTALDGYLLQVGANPAASQKIWDALPPLSGTNRFGQPKPGANILARAGSTRGEPIMIGAETGQGACSPSAARPGSGPAPPTRAGPRTGGSGGRSSSGSRARKTRARTRSRSPSTVVGSPWGRRST